MKTALILLALALPVQAMADLPVTIPHSPSCHQRVEDVKSNDNVLIPLGRSLCWGPGVRQVRVEGDFFKFDDVNGLVAEKPGYVTIVHVVDADKNNKFFFVRAVAP
jgi:hypothetical protein